MAEYSRMAKGSFTATGTSQVIALPFQPDYVELWNYSIIKTAANHGVTRAWWDNKIVDASTGNNATMIELYSGGTTTVVFDTIQTNGISSFAAGQLLQFGPVNQHGSSIGDFSINLANPAQITTTSAHGLASGQVVVFSNLAQSSSTGMQQIAGIPFVITVTGTTTFTIPWNTNQSNYTAFNTATSTNNVGSYKQVLYPALYAPNVAFISSLTLANPMVVSLTTPGNFQVGQQVAFRVPSVWGTTQLNSLPDTLIPGQPIYGYVTAVSASLTTPTITVNINSTGYTAFNSNLLYASYPGQKFAQVAPVGDINSGGNPFSATSGLYPPPVFWDGFNNATSNSINGPAILGAFVNNTLQGFTIGAGTAAVDGTGTLIANNNIVLWHAYLHDLASP